MEAGLCPKCKSDNISYLGPEFDDSLLWYEANCNDCKTEFDELYEMKYLESEIKETSSPFIDDNLERLEFNFPFSKTIVIPLLEGRLNDLRFLTLNSE